MGFVEAVETVLGSSASYPSFSLPVKSAEQAPPKKWVFYPPKPLRYGRSVEGGALTAPLEIKSETPCRNMRTLRYN
jgi:hypothetical protein